MVNEKNTEASGTCNAIAEKHDGKTVNSETLNALSGLMDEMHMTCPQKTGPLE